MRCSSGTQNSWRGSGQFRGARRDRDTRWLSGREHDLAKGVSLCQVTIRHLHILQRIDMRDGDHYFALANRIGEVCQDADAVTIAVDGAAALGLHPILCGGVKVGDGVDAFRAHAEGERQLYVVGAIRVDEGVDWFPCHGTDALRYTITIRDRDDATQLEPWMMRRA